MSRHRHIALALVVISGSCWTLPAFGQSGAQNGEWRHVGGDAGNSKYAPLDQINRTNAKDLRIAWRWRTDNFGPTPIYNNRVTPLFVNGILYTTAGSRRTVVAIDGATGETLWMYRVDEGARAEHTAGNARMNPGRGLAYWTDGREPRIFFITSGFVLVALDAKTGQPVRTFGTNGDGQVDMRQGLDRPLRPVDEEKDLIGSTSPPVIVKDVIIASPSLGDGSGAPARMEAVPGYVRGYDARTGELKWTFHTIPRADEFGNETWKNDAWTYTGHAAVWTLMSVDEELGYVYLPIESATSDYYGGHRLGDNLFSNSLVCLDAATGRRVWYFQITHHDLWDYDLPAPPTLMDITVAGQSIKAVAQVTKQGFVFVFDRVTGHPVWPIEERPVPQTDVPGEETSPTQPFPTKLPPFERQGVSMDDLIDFTPELRAQAVEIVSKLRLGTLYTPPSLVEPGGTQGTLIYPSATGGGSWQGAAADLENGLLFVPSATYPSVLGLGPDSRSNLRYVGFKGMRLTGAGGPGGLPLVKPPWGRITAYDLKTGELLWQVANGDTPAFIRNHPALKGVTLPKSGTIERSGLLVTRTLLFAGEGGGMFVVPRGVGAGGPMFRAYDKMTGEVVAEVELPANQTGQPMTYMVNGKQYIVMAIGAPGHPSELVALTLP